MIIAQGLALAGLPIGVVRGLILVQVLSSFSASLFGVPASDPATFGAVSLVLIAVAVFACYTPLVTPRAPIPWPLGETSDSRPFALFLFDSETTGRLVG